MIVAVSVVLLLSFYPQNFFKNYATDRLFDDTGHPVGGDYVNIWTAARVVLVGHVNDLFDVKQFHPRQEALFGRELPPFNWSYPPHFVPWIIPFGVPSYLWSLVLWSAVTFAAYAVAVMAGRPRKWSILPVIVLAPSSFVNLMAGQNGFLTAALMIGGLRLLEQNPIWAGLLFGLLTIKPQLGLLVPIALVAARAWSAFWSACATIAVLIVVSIALFGIEPWHAYVATTMPYQRAILEGGEGIFTAMMPTPFMAVRHLGWDLSTGYVLNGVTAVICVLLVAWIYRRVAIPNDLRICIFATAIFLTTPYAFNYDMTILSAAMIGLLAHQSSEQLRPGELLAIIATWILPIALLSVMNMTGQRLSIGPYVLGAMLTYLVARANAISNPSGNRDVLGSSAGA